jgi:thiol-disulfide isomerase/thioredoxin
MRRLIPFLIAFASVAQAQTPAGQTLNTEWPSTTTKKTLYAKQDLRGKAAPKIEVAEWLTGAAPNTKGKVILLDFWATWCPPCRETIPELNAIAAKCPKDVVVIGVSAEKAETVRAFMKKTKMAYSVAVDPSGKMDKQVGVQGIPHVLVISPDGIVRWQGFPLDDTERLTEATVARIVARAKARP